MARLYVLSGPDLGKSFEVVPGATLGRSTDCAAVMRDHSVSRQHARLECHDGRWSVVDLGSRNGLLFAGKKSLRAELADGAEFQLGEVLLRFRSAVSEAPTVLETPAQAAPAPAPPPPPLEDEIVLEGALDEPPPARREPPPAPKPVVPFPKPASPSPELVRTARMQNPARGGVGGLEQRERGILQYSKVENRGGLFEADIAQQPWYTKLGLWLLALALCALLGWAAFRATSFFKEKVAGPSSDTAPAEER